jgi:phage shock protein A
MQWRAVRSTLGDMQDLRSFKRGIVGVVAARRRLQMRGDELRNRLDELEREFQQAMAADRLDLARSVLERKRSILAEQWVLDHRVGELQAEQRRLIECERQLETQMRCHRSVPSSVTVEHLRAARILEDLIGFGAAQDDVKRELDELGVKESVDEELAKLKAGLASDGED